MKDSCFTKEYGKEIYLLNFSYDHIEEALPLIQECARQIRQRPAESVLTLTIIDRGKFTTELVEKLKDLTKGNRPYVRKAAVVGVCGMYKIVISAVSIFSKREFKLFDTKEEAIRYLLAE